MNRRVRLGALAARDLQQARDWFDRQEQGLGDTFLERVNETIQRIARNPDQYQLAVFDLHRAPVRAFNTPSGIVSCRIRRSSWRA